MSGLPKVLFIFLFGFLVFDLILISQDRAVKPLLTGKRVSVVAQTRRIAKPSTDFGKILAMTTSGSQVLGAETLITPSPTPTEVVSPKKKSYKIAAIGDSMIETMGDSLDYLKADLKKKYPGTQFIMYNYGVGAENVSTADDQFDIPFVHGDKSYPPLSELKPDVLIVGSFAYNPFATYDRNKHWLMLSDLVGKAQKVTNNVYLLAEIAPSEKNFGRGPGGVNWPQDIVGPHLQKIIEQMQNAIGISKAMNVPLIDVYGKSRDGDSPYGKEDYISSNDHIHPSVAGQIFTAQEIVNSIKLDP